MVVVDVSSTILPFSSVYTRNLECSFERRLGGRHGFEDHAHERYAGHGYFVADVSMQPPGGPPSRDTSYDRPNQNSQEKDDAKGGRGRREGPIGKREGDGEMGIAAQQQTGEATYSRRGKRKRKRGGGAASRENKRKMVKEANTKRGVRYDRGRNLLIRP